MNADERGYFDSLTERVLGAVFEVANTLGAGFLEKVYERALLKELTRISHRKTLPSQASEGQVTDSRCDRRLCGDGRWNTVCGGRTIRGSQISRHGLLALPDEPMRSATDVPA